MIISKELRDDLLKGCEQPEDPLGDAGLMKELKIKLMERLLSAELTAHSLPGRVLRSNIPKRLVTKTARARCLIQPTGTMARQPSASSAWMASVSQRRTFL